MQPLTALVRRSLLTVLPGTAPRRYRMLRTIKHFAWQQSDPAERRWTEGRHRTHVLARVAARQSALYGPNSAEVMGELSADQAEHRAALVSALAAGEAHCALGLAGGLYWFWYRMGRIGEGLGFLHAALDAVVADHLAPERRQFARATAGVASLTYLTGNRPAASDAARESAAAWAAAGDRAEAARLSAWCGYFLSMDGDHDAGLDLVRDSAATARALGSGFAEADARMVLGMLLRNHGRPLEARGELVTAIAIAERIGNRWSVGSSTWALMKSAMDAGDVDAAMSAARDMQSVLEVDGDVTSWLVLMHHRRGPGWRRAPRGGRRARGGGAVTGRPDRVPARGDGPDRRSPGGGCGARCAQRTGLCTALRARSGPRPGPDQRTAVQPGRGECAKPAVRAR
ncbi:hypothetical protein [Rhodococcus sp. PvR099]|uniref:hypothetical protein n=1 Tax=Rhodococcus sp. PvR099 TaxID=2806602 RepID=UPI001B5D75C9|nr:hypothetical protein [Rhodococcus sp. PvR099]MBP1159100.1 hypothetical protein [Rhodococcus sp. PvR099]